MADPTSTLLSKSTPVSSAALSEPITLNLNTTNTLNSNSKTNEISHTDHVQGVSGKLIFKQNIRPKEEGTPADYSYVELSQLDGAYIKLMAGGMARMEGPNVLSLNSGSDTYIHTLQNRQDFIGLNQLTYIKGNHKFVVGAHDEEIRKYTEELQSINTTIAKTALDTALVEEEENVPCKVCNAKTEQPSSMYDTITIFNAAQGWIADNLPAINFIISPIMKILNTFVAFPSKIIKMAAGRDKKTKSCGSCKDGYVKGSRKTLNKMTQARSELIQQQSPRIEELHRKIGDAGNFVTCAAGDVYIGSGLVRNEAPCFIKKGTWNEPISFTQPPQSGSVMVYTSKGNTERSIHQDPGSLCKGNMTFHSAEKFSVFAGSPGILAETNGEFTVRAGQLELRAAEGEAHFGSGNLTVINGNNVRIIGKGNKGDDGIQLEADNVFVKGALNVATNLNLKGHIVHDGELFTNFLNCPAMAAPVETKEPSQAYTHVQSKAFTAPVLRAAQVAKDTIVKTVIDLGEIITPRGMMNFIKDKYDLTVAGGVLDPVSSGIHFQAHFIIPIEFYTIAPIWNYYHNHRLTNLETRGSVAVPRGNYSTTGAGTRAARPVGSAIPLAARSEGTFPSGGFGTQPGPCGGGNLFSKNLEQRNLQYGVDALDPFQGLNFIDRYNQNSNIVTAVSGNTGFLPPVVNPRFSLLTATQTSSALDVLDCN